MPLTIKPPRHPSQPQSGPESSQQVEPSIPSSHDSQQRPPSPVAPAFSPITPKVKPVLPALCSQNESPFVPPLPSHTATAAATAAAQPVRQNGNQIASDQSGTTTPQRDHGQTTAQLPQSSIQPTRYVDQPPNLPFSGEDAADALALKAAISTLQYQKQKARNDLRLLQTIKQQAQADPERFRSELAAGRLKERRDRIGDLQNIIDNVEEGDDDDEVDLFTSARTGHDVDMDDADGGHGDARAPQKPFPTIPGPQNVVRMPPVNWDKYHVVGQALDSIHEQQRRWPGQAPFQADRGREHVVAAPYNPFQDRLDEQASVAATATNQRGSVTEGRRDSRQLSDVSAPSPLSAFGEHPMETRRIHERRP